MYDLFLCMEMEGLYHINQQLSELLACILLDDEVMFLVILERKVYFFAIFPCLGYLSCYLYHTTTFNYLSKGGYFLYLLCNANHAAL